MAERLWNGMWDWIVDSKAKRIRGSFITLVTTGLLWFIVFAFMYLVMHVVINHEEKLSDLTTLILGMFGFISGAYTAVTALYMTGKVKKELAAGEQSSQAANHEEFERGRM